MPVELRSRKLPDMDEDDEDQKEPLIEIEGQQGQDHEDNHEGPKLKGDEVNVLVLFFLYVLQVSLLGQLHIGGQRGS